MEQTDLNSKETIEGVELYQDEFLRKPNGLLYTMRNLFDNHKLDVEKLARDLMRKYIHLAREKEDDVLWSSIKDAIIESYNQAKSETMFILEDIRNAIREGRNSIHFENDGSWWEDETVEETFIQSLTKQKQYEFVVEHEIVCDDNNYGNGEVFHENRKEIPKIVNGKIQGTWKGI